MATLGEVCRPISTHLSPGYCRLGIQSKLSSLNRVLHYAFGFSWLSASPTCFGFVRLALPVAVLMESEGSSLLQTRSYQWLSVLGLVA